MLSLAKTHKLAPRKRHVLPPGFWDRVDKSGGEDACWEWMMPKTTGGYGQFRRGDKMYAPHRVVLQWATQKEGKDLFATHGPCHNKGCVNPEHLSWKTPKGNAADRTRDGTEHHGEEKAQSKLTEAQVLAIRSDPRPQRQIAVAYGIARSNVHHIKSRHKWGWLD